MEKFLGIDIGGTNIKFGVVDTNGDLSDKVKYSTLEARGEGDFVEKLLTIVGTELDKHDDIKKVGIGLPGTLTKDRSTLLELPNIPELNGVNLHKALSERFDGHHFHLENDANAAALGEYYFSGSEMPENYIFVTLGTGVGGGVVIDHEIFTGGDGNGIEIGHMMVSNKKTLEQNIGKKGIMNRVDELLSFGTRSKITSEEEVDPKKIIKLAENGDKLSQFVYKEVGSYLGEALVSMIRLLDVKTILIGGGLAAGYNLIYKSLKEKLTYNLTPYYTEKIDIRKASLGNNAGIVGAASLCFMEEARGDIF